MKNKNLKIARFVLDRNQAAQILGGVTPPPPPPPGGGSVIVSPKPLDCACDCPCHKTKNDGCISGTGTLTGPA